MSTLVKDAERLTHRAEAVGVPSHLIGGLVAYIVDRRPVGDFLRAVVENNLREAFARADVYSTAGMREIVAFLYTYAPNACWGSPEKVSLWLAEDVDGH